MNDIFPMIRYFEERARASLCCWCGMCDIYWVLGQNKKQKKNVKSGKFIESSRADNTRQWAPSVCRLFYVVLPCLRSGPILIAHPHSPLSPPPQHTHTHTHTTPYLSRTHPCISLSPSLTRCVGYIMLHTYKGKLSASYVQYSSQVSKYTAGLYHVTLRDITNDSLRCPPSAAPLRINIKRIPTTLL